MNATLQSKLIALVLGVFLVACGGETSKSEKQQQLDKLQAEQADLTKKINDLEAEIGKSNPDSVKTRAKEVAVQKIAAQPFDYFVKTQGSVEAEDNILVSARSMGVITAVYVKEGQHVTKGQALAQIDNGAMVQNIEGVKSQLALAKTIYERQKNLWDQKIGTEVQFLQSKTNMEALQQQVAGMQEQNSNTRITSPISGSIDQINIKIGQNISPGMPAVRVVNTSDLKLKAHVSEAYVTRIRKGDKVLVSVPELHKDIEAKVSFVAQTIDPLSRTFAVEIKLPSNPDLRPNMTGIAKVIFKSVAEAIVVPVNVIQDLNDEKVVFVTETKGQQTVARKRVVKIDGVYDERAVVEGLKVGDQIISFGYQGLNDGQVIKM